MSASQLPSSRGGVGYLRAGRSLSGDEDGEEDDDEGFSNYYDHDGEDTDMDRGKEEDPEYFEYQLLAMEDVGRLLNESVEADCKSIQVSCL